MTRMIVRLMNSLITLAVSVVLILAGLYAAYALWDNQQIYSAAESTQLEMLRYKPKTVDDDGAAMQAPSFEELLKINPDVCAWISMENTAIDYPILQGRDNLTYINTDVYGRFALAGSIFLDSRCRRDFTDSFCLLYGHHMDNHGMFGDLDLYKDQAFFRNNQEGELILPAGTRRLKILACIVTEASDDIIFEPDYWQDTSLSELAGYCAEHALYVNKAAMQVFLADAEGYEKEREKDQAGTAPGILALSTCSGEYTNARTVLITQMLPFGDD